MKVSILKVVSKCRNSCGVIHVCFSSSCGHREFPELAIIILGRNERRNHRECSEIYRQMRFVNFVHPFPSLPSERSVCPSPNDEAICKGSTIASPYDVDIVHICSRNLCPNLGNQVNNEADIVRLALLSVDVPAPLIAISRNNDTVISQPAAKNSCISLTTIACIFSIF
jgi:hypothetical protein